MRKHRMTAGEKQGFQLKYFNDVQRCSTAAKIGDRTFLKYLPYVKLFLAYNRTSVRVVFNPWFLSEFSTNLNQNLIIFSLDNDQHMRKGLCQNVCYFISYGVHKKV